MFEDGPVQETWEQQAEDAAKAAAAPLWSLTDAEIVECLHTVHRWEKNVAALKARLVQEIAGRGVPAGQGHRGVPGWLRAQLLIDPQPARELALQAAALRAHPSLEQAVIDGRVDVRQTVVIADAVDAIPAAIDGLELSPEAPDLPTMAAAAEATLIEMAARFPAGQLRRLGDRILVHVAPEIAERSEEAVLRRQERLVHQARSFTLSRPVGGAVRLTGILDTESAAIVEAALQPLCRPTPGDDRTPRQLRADALVDVCRLALRTGELPVHGGEPTQLAVTVPFEPLSQALRAASLDNGERLSSTTARRLACDARVLPLVLGSQGQILDAGRSRRLAHGPLRRALAVRDGGCAFPDCDRPPRWCDAHHLKPWTEGGSTSLDNLVLVCRHHHRLLHEPDHGWLARLGPDQLPEFIPPPWTDRHRQPRRNLYHPRT
jgi:Domain of unknown function (DUF222)/HNH endonuclease